ncbi:MAG: ABC-2 transporter permease, partial [Lachnospiraceae bacterium]|nr:ABC-2 transporter permease [Lachnospiraceae bacterium]
VITSLSLSTISYDEYENSDSYLFSLPITRTEYVKEKYLFAFMNTGAGWLLAVLLVLGCEMIKNQAISIQMLSLIGGMNLICAAAYIAVCLPLWIKLGPEKGRITFFILAGVIVLAVSFSKMFTGDMNPEALASVWNALKAYPLLIESILGGIVLLGVGISYLISLRIVRKKEY